MAGKAPESLLNQIGDAEAADARMRENDEKFVPARGKAAKVLAQTMEDMPEIERTIIEYRFASGMTPSLDALSQSLGIHRDELGSLEAQALARIKDALLAEGIKSISSLVPSDDS